MTNLKHIKRALCSSVIALLVCFTMLLGTTFAWFTDSVSSDNNVITAGNLAIDVEYTLDGENWNDLDGATDLFQKGLWEPGHTEVVALRVKNNGTLALKYAVNMNVISEIVGKTKDGADIVLSDILTVSTLTQEAIDENGIANQIGDITLMLAFNGENSVGYENTSEFKASNVLKGSEMLLPGTAHYVIVKVDMADSVGNEANYNGTDVPTINFGINVLATQFNYENDSFGSDYDKDSKFPVYVVAGEEKAQVIGESATEILASLTSGNDLLVDEDMDLLGFDANEVDAQGATVTLNGKGPEAYGYLAFLPDAGEDVTVSNLNVSGSGFVEIGHYGMGGGNYVANNVNIKNVSSTLANGDKGNTLGCAFMAFGDLTLNNCVMTGTTADDGVIAVDLGCGQAWNGYTDENDNNISTTINGGEYGTIYCWSHSIVTVNGAKVDTIYVSPIKGNVTIKAGTEIETLIVDYGTSANNVTQERLQKLVIEEGAIVKEIVYAGTTYTVEEWNAFVSAFGA